MARIPIDVHGNTIFLGFEESCGPWYSIFRGWTGILVEPVRLYATAVGSESVYSWHDPVTWPKHWIAFTVKPFFQVLRSLLVRDRASFTGEMCSGLVSQHCVLLQLDQKVYIHDLIQCKWLEHWLALMAKPVFQVLRSLLDLSRFSWVKKCPGEVIQHYSTRWHCIWLRKVCIHDFTVWSSTTG